MRNVPNDQKLYDRIKRGLFSKMAPSAYRSGALVRAYKAAFKRKHGSKKPYRGRKNKDGMTRWFRERWRTQDGGKTYKKRGDIFRPTVRVSRKTPKTMSELTKKDIKRAMRQKRRGRVKKF